MVATVVVIAVVLVAVDIVVVTMVSLAILLSHHPLPLCAASLC